MTSKSTVEMLNNCSQDEFTETLAEIFEHSSWIPERSWALRPFSDTEQLLSAMIQIVDSSRYDERMSLLRAHPQLAGKEAENGTLTDSSTEEQSTANLNSLSKQEMDEISELNRLYLEKHSFPFIIAVKNHDKAGIFNEFSRRLQNDCEIEFSTALEQVGFIARFRLDALLASE